MPATNIHVVTTSDDSNKENGLTFFPRGTRRSSKRRRISSARESYFDYSDLDNLTKPKIARSMQSRFASPSEEQKICLAKINSNGQLETALVRSPSKKYTHYSPSRITKTTKGACTNTPSKTKLHINKIQITRTKEVIQQSEIVKLTYHEHYNLFHSDPKPTKAEDLLALNAMENNNIKVSNSPDTFDKKSFHLKIGSAQVTELKKILKLSYYEPRNQNKIMGYKTASKVAEENYLVGYLTDNKARRKIALFEWGHLGEFALLKKLGLQPQARDNLVAMTRECNTHMMILEQIIRDYIEDYDENLHESIEIDVVALLRVGTELGTKLNYAITLHYQDRSSVTIDQEIDALSNAKPTKTLRDILRKFYAENKSAKRKLSFEPTY